MPMVRFGSQHFHKHSQAETEMKGEKEIDKVIQRRISKWPNYWVAANVPKQNTEEPSLSIGKSLKKPTYSYWFVCDWVHHHFCALTDMQKCSGIKHCKALWVETWLTNSGMKLPISSKNLFEDFVKMLSWENAIVW